MFVINFIIFNSKTGQIKKPALRVSNFVIIPETQILPKTSHILQYPPSTNAGDTLRQLAISQFAQRLDLKFRQPAQGLLKGFTGVF